MSRAAGDAEGAQGRRDRAREAGATADKGFGPHRRTSTLFVRQLTPRSDAALRCPHELHQLPPNSQPSLISSSGIGLAAPSDQGSTRSPSAAGRTCASTTAAARRVPHTLAALQNVQERSVGAMTSPGEEWETMKEEESGGGGACAALRRGAGSGGAN